MWEEAGITGENPGVQARSRHTLSHTSTVDHRSFLFKTLALYCLLHLIYYFFINYELKC